MSNRLYLFAIFIFVLDTETSLLITRRHFSPFLGNLGKNPQNLQKFKLWTRLWMSITFLRDVSMKNGYLAIVCSFPVGPRKISEEISIL